MFGGIRGWMSACLVAAAVIAAAGCGSGDEESTAQDKPKYSAANEPPKAFIERVAKLLETATTKKDCAQLDEANLRSQTRLVCPSDKKMRTSMKSFEVVGAEQYGTGAVIDYKSGTVKDGGAILLFATPERTWAISRFGVITPPSVGTDDSKARAGYMATAKAYLEAVRERDCDAYLDVALTREAPKKELCKTTFTLTKPLAKRLKDDPSAKPKYVGGNGTYGFLTLETQKPRLKNSTISVVKGGSGAKATYVVLNVAASPTSADQKKAVEAAKQQQNSPQGMEPSSKPSDPAVETTP